MKLERQARLVPQLCHIHRLRRRPVVVCWPCGGRTRHPNFGYAAFFMAWGIDSDFTRRIFPVRPTSFCRAIGRSCSFTAASGMAMRIANARRAPSTMLPRGQTRSRAIADETSETSMRSARWDGTFSWCGNARCEIHHVSKHVYVRSSKASERPSAPCGCCRTSTLLA